MAESIYRFLMQDALSTGGGQDDALKDKKGDMEKDENRRTNKKSLQQQIGIQLTLAGILKQSSIFTGFIGSLFQIVGAFIDTLLMSAFPLLKTALKFIMKFFDPIKALAGGIGTLIEVVMKIFSKIRDFLPESPLPGGFENESLFGVLGNVLRGGAGTTIGGTTKNIFSKFLPGLKNAPLIGRLLQSADLLMSLNEDTVLDAVISATQSLVSISLASTAFTAGSAGGPIGLGIAAGGVAYYETMLAPALDQAIKDTFYSLAGRVEEDRAYSQAPVD